MSNVQMLCKLAKQLKANLCIEHDPEGFKFTVFIDKVVHKEKHLRRSIEGKGFTIEDACTDYLRISHGGELENWLTDKVVDVI